MAGFGTQEPRQRPLGAVQSQDAPRMGNAAERITIPGALTGYDANGKRQMGSLPEPEHAMYHVLATVNGQETVYHTPEEFKLRQSIVDMLERHITDNAYRRKLWASLTPTPDSKSAHTAHLEHILMSNAVVVWHPLPPSSRGNKETNDIAYWVGKKEPAPA
jgi:hypothetical protein